MKKTTSPFDSVTAAATSRQKATRYVTPNGKERHVDENLRKAFNYLITMWDGTVSSGKMNMVHVGARQPTWTISPRDFSIALTKCPPMSLNF
jgi:hypothetical protein